MAVFNLFCLLIYFALNFSFPFLLAILFDNLTTFSDKTLSFAWLKRRNKIFVLDLRKGSLIEYIFFVNIRLNWVEAQYTLDFPNLSLKLYLMVCLISKRISWPDIAFYMNTAMVSFKYSNLNIQMKMFRWSAENRFIKRVHVYMFFKDVIFISQHFVWKFCILSKCDWMNNL